MRTFIYALPLLFTLGISGCKKDKSNEIVIPANSVDALAKAIQNAEEGSTIRLATGTHTESGTVYIDKKICLVGDDGAVLIVNTAPTVVNGVPLDPAIHVYGTEEVCVKNIELRPVGAFGGSGVIFEKSDKSSIENCEIYLHQFSVVLEASHDITIENNIINPDGWQTLLPPTAAAHGILLINGDRAKIRGNTLTNAFFGAWIGSSYGELNNNVINDNYIGVIPCAIPDSSAVMPRSNVVYTMIPGYRWKIKDNKCENNLLVGILLYDGARECVVENNDCKNNGLINVNGPIDIELGKYHAPGSSSLGVPFPLAATQHDTVIAGSYPNIRIRDCGWSNVVIGAPVIKDGKCF